MRSTDLSGDVYLKNSQVPDPGPGMPTVAACWLVVLLGMVGDVARGGEVGGGATHVLLIGPLVNPAAAVQLRL